MRIAIEIVGILVVLWAIFEGLRRMSRTYARGAEREDKSEDCGHDRCSGHESPSATVRGKPARKTKTPTEE